MFWTKANVAEEALTAAKGTANFLGSGIIVDVMDEGIILGAWKWFGELLKADPKLSAGTYVIIEVMQPAGPPSLMFADEGSLTFRFSSPYSIRSNRVPTVHGPTPEIVTYCRLVAVLDPDLHRQMHWP
jgi:hypothetical protein